MWSEKLWREFREYLIIQISLENLISLERLLNHLIIVDLILMSKQIINQIAKIANENFVCILEHIELIGKFQIIELSRV